jgi:hypothetical protein
MAKNKVRRTPFQLSRSRLERGLDLRKASLRRRAQPSRGASVDRTRSLESAPAMIQALTRTSAGSPMSDA